MKAIKKVCFLLMLTFAFVTFSAFTNVSAESNIITSSELVIEGAAVRTTGKKGIKFVGNINNFDDSNVEIYGIAILFGKYEVSDDFVFDGVVDGKKVYYGYKKAVNEKNQYNVTIYNFPEEMYLTTISARPFVKLNDGTYVYGEHVIQRSLGEVVLKAINNGTDGTDNLIGDVESAIVGNDEKLGYMKYGFDSFGDFVISSLFESDPTRLRDIFIADYNSFLSSINDTNTLGTDTEWLDFYYATAPNQTDENGNTLKNSYNTDISSANIYKFFKNEKMFDKWSWLLDWFVSENNDLPFIKRQVNAIYSLDGTYTDTEYHSNYIADNVLSNLVHLLSSLYSFFYNDTIDHNGSGSIVFGTKVSYENMLKYNNRVYADLSKYDVAKIGTTIKLPDATLDTEINTGYNNGDFSISDEVTVDKSGAIYTPDYDNGYSIIFLDGNNKVNAIVYDGKSDVVFDAYEPEGYIFEGWYESEDLLGKPVKGLEANTKGDKVYYAKLYKGTHIIVDSNISASNGENVNVNGVNYEYGTTAFTSLIDAITVANKIETDAVLIEVACGSYKYSGNANSVSINRNNIKIIGPNYNVNGNDTREDEAIIDNLFITINSQLSNVEFNGLKFIGNSKIYNRNTTYGLNITGFTFTNNYVSSTNCVNTTPTSKNTGFIEFDAVGTYYSTNVTITDNYFEYDLTNNVKTDVEVELIALDNVCNLNLSGNVFKNIKDIAIHIYDKKKGLSGENNKINNNEFINVPGDAIRINWLSPTNATGTNNTVSIDENTFTNVDGKCISIGYVNNKGNSVAGNDDDYYKKLSISGNIFNSSSEDYIYLYRCYENWTLVLNDNVFNAIPTRYYMYVYSNENTLYYPLDTVYKNNGNQLKISDVDKDKFSSSIIYAQSYEITYMYNGKEITSLADTYFESDEDYYLKEYSITNGVFEGWYDNPEFNGDAITYISKGDKGNKVYYAKITIYYTIKYFYESQELTDILPTTYKQGDSFELPNYVVSDSNKYIFEGWYENSNLIIGYIDKVTSDFARDLVLYAKVTVIKTKYIVDDDYSSKKTGDVISLNGEEYIYGTTAFSTIKDAVNAANNCGSDANVNIIVASGSYSGSFDITASNITLTGPNAGIKGNATRNSEAVFLDSYIRLGKQVTNIEINGFKLSGTSRVYKSDKSVSGGTVSNFVVDIDGFIFTNNYVDTSNTYGFAQFIDSSYSYSKNIVFSNNYFTQSATATYYLWLNNCYNVTIINNVFKNITGTAVYIDGSTVGLIGECNMFNNNIFDTVAGDAILIKNIDPIADEKNCSLSFDNNTFRSITGSCINIEKMKGNSNFGSKAYSYISMTDNIFDISYTNGIYVNNYNKKMNLNISTNIFNVVPDSYYIYIESTTIIYTLNNEYLDGATSIEPSSSKFSSNIAYKPEALEIISMGNGVVKVGDTIQYSANYASAKWTSSNVTVAKIDENGLITGISAGTAVITATIEGVSFSTGVTVYDDSYSELMQLLLQNNSGVILNQDIIYYGFLAGYEEMEHNIYGSANNYWTGKISIDSTTYKLSSTDGNYGSKMTPKYITVHDTASTTTNAKQTAYQVVNPENTSSSWHYSTGTDGVYQTIPDTISAAHAGDGSRVSGFTKTSVKGPIGSTVQLPVTVKNKRFYLGGEDTGISIPSGATNSTPLPSTGIYHYVGTDGYYYLANTYYNKTYKYISMMGGNKNSIGIETSVKHGTDIYHTWQITSKLVAQLLVKWDLNTSQVRQHNNFAGKDCPKTMRTAGLWDTFMNMVEVEYTVLKEYSDWTISFDSSNEAYLDNDGRVQTRPEETVGTSYTITVKSPEGKVEKAELYVVIPGHENNVLEK